MIHRERRAGAPGGPTSASRTNDENRAAETSDSSMPQSGMHDVDVLSHLDVGLTGALLLQALRLLWPGSVTW